MCPIRNFSLSFLIGSTVGQERGTSCFRFRFIHLSHSISLYNLLNTTDVIISPYLSLVLVTYEEHLCAMHSSKLFCQDVTGDGSGTSTERCGVFWEGRWRKIEDSDRAWGWCYVVFLTYRADQGNSCLPFPPH